MVCERDAQIAHFQLCKLINKNVPSGARKIKSGKLRSALDSLRRIIFSNGTGGGSALIGNLVIGGRVALTDDDPNTRELHNQINQGLQHAAAGHRWSSKNYPTYVSNCGRICLHAASIRA
jgi:hypothetical protein